MKKVLMLSLVALVAIPAGGCSLFASRGDLDKASVERLGANFELVAKRYEKYDGADLDTINAARGLVAVMKDDLDPDDLDRFEAKIQEIFPKYLALVRGDPELNASEKETEVDLVASTQRLIDSMQKRLGD